MGSHNPGRYRREGREAYEPNSDPKELCPYRSDTFWDISCRNYWREGWEEAAAVEKQPSSYDKYELIRERINKLCVDPNLVDVLTDIVTLIERK